MSAFTRDEIIAQLVAKNIPRHMAERAADAEIGVHMVPREVIAERGVALGAPAHAFARPGDRLIGVELEAPAPAIAWPVRLLLPWSYLVSDNDKTRARLITRHGKPAAINVITTEYAGAKEKIANVVRAKIGDAEAVRIPLGIRGLVWVPDARPHDVANFCKLVHDALEGVVYTNDRWLHDVHWTRAGVDVDAPRAEITITPIPS